MAIAPVAGHTYEHNYASSTTIPVTLGFTPAIGNVVVLEMDWFSSSANSVSSITGAGSWAALGAKYIDTASDGHATHAWWAPITTATPTLSIVFSGAVTLKLRAYEVSGADLTTQPDNGVSQKTQASVAAGTDAISATALATVTDGAMVVGWNVVAFQGSLSALAAGTGYTGLGTANTDGYSEYLIQGTHGSITPTFTPTGSSSDDVIWNYALRPASGTPAPTLTAAGTGNAFTATATGVTLTGTNLGANTGARTLSLVQGGTSVTQTQTAGDATSGTFNVVFDGVSPSIKYGAATLRATVTAVNGDLAVTVTAPAGKSYKDLTTPNTTAANRITAVADLATGDQLEISNVQGGLITDVNVNADATFDVASAVTAFDVRGWSTADSTWGAVATQTIGSAATGIVLADTEVVNGVVTRLGSFGLKTSGTLVQVL